jgi:SAM-dependent methyltransferase
MRCGSGRTLPFVSPEQLGPFYPEAYNAYALPRNPVLRLAATLLYRWRYLRGLRRPPLGALRGLAPGRLLDVGSGRGDLGVVLQARGWEVTGLEPSEAACAEARARGVPTERGTLATSAGRLTDGYDAVVFQHTLEHVVEPREDLAAVYGLLRDGGHLLVSVPNFSSWQRKRFGSSWFHLDLPRHRSHFSPRGLELLLRSLGFSEIAMSTATSADAVPMTLQYRFFGYRRADRGPARLAALALTFLLVPLSLAGNALAGEGDLLHATALKVSSADEPPASP